MTTTAPSTYHVVDTGTKTGFTQDLVSAARDNPISTALISMGVLWMVLGDSRRSLLQGAKSLASTASSTVGAGGQRVGAGVSSATTSIADAATSGYGTVTGHAAELGSNLGEAATRSLHDVRDGAGKVGSGVSAAIEAAKQTLSGPTSQSSAGRGGRTADQASDLIGSLKEQVSDVLQRQPLVAGAVGLAIGAGLAAALPRVAAEDALVRPVGAFKERVQTELGNAYERGVKEARAQGLTPDGVSDALAEVKDRVMEVATSGRDETKP